MDIKTLDSLIFGVDTSIQQLHLDKYDGDNPNNKTANRNVEYPIKLMYFIIQTLFIISI